MASPPRLGRHGERSLLPTGESSSTAVLLSLPVASLSAPGSCLCARAGRGSALGEQRAVALRAACAATSPSPSAAPDAGPAASTLGRSIAARARTPGTRAPVPNTTRIAAIARSRRSALGAEAGGFLDTDTEIGEDALGAVRLFQQAPEGSGVVARAFAFSAGGVATCPQPRRPKFRAPRR